MKQPQLTMSVDILTTGTCDLDMMRDLNDLASELQNADLSVETASAEVPGVKDGGLTIAIALTGLVLSSISTLVTVLSYWNSKKPKYAVTLKSQGTTFNLTSLDKNEIRNVVQKIKAGDSPGDIVVQVAKR
jgi:hypothetical protein